MTTANLGLSSTTSAAGSAVTFLTWRLLQDGDSASNMIKIDNWVGEASGSIVTLESGVVFNSAGADDGGGNYTSTVTGIGSYTTGTIINLTLDVTNTGTATLNINGLGTKTLNKLATNGTVINMSAGDLVADRYYFFVYDGTQWMWVSPASGDQINIPAGAINEIVILSGSGITNSGVLITDIPASSGSFIVMELNSTLHNEWLISAGSSVSLGQDFSASAVWINVIATGALDASGSELSLQTGGVLTTSGSELSVRTGGVLSSSGSELSLQRGGVLTTSGSELSVRTGGVLSSSGSELSLQRGGALSTSGSELSLNASGIVSGSYTAVDVNTYGLVTGGSVTATIASISGSSVMSDTTGSEVRHNSSGITSGSYNAVDVDIFGHVTGGSVVAAGGTASIQTDQSGGGTHTYGDLVGDIDGANKVYTVSQSSYTTATLTVYLNGQLQTQGDTGDWVETVPGSGTFTFDVAPLTGDNITAIYQY